jgi:hypothetical protein
MKSNLKTIKKALQNHEELQDAISFSKLKGEVKGFEKELRTMEIPDKYVELKGIHVFEWLLQEILGK